MAIDCYTVFIETTLATNFATNVSDSLIVSDFKKKILEEHTQCFPEIGDVKIKSVKVKRGAYFYYLVESMIVKSAFHGVDTSWYIYVDISRVEPCVPLNGIGEMVLDEQLETEGLVNGVDLSLKTPILEEDNVEEVLGEGFAKKKSKNDLPLESSEETFQAAAIGEDKEDNLPSGHIGTRKKTKKKKTSHPTDQEIAPVHSYVTRARCKGSKETAAATFQYVKEKLLSQDVDMTNSSLVIVESHHDLSKPAGPPDAKEMKDSRITKSETDVVVRPEFKVGETEYPKKSKKIKMSKRIRDTSQPLTLDAEQVEGQVPVAEPQTVSRDQATQDNLEEKVMRKGDDASETAMVTGLSLITSEHLEVGDTVSPKKASHKRKKSKRSSHSARLDAEQVEGSLPVISSTHQTFNENHSNQDKWGKNTMKGGQSASETTMVGDLHLATGKEINDIIENVVNSVRMETAHLDTGFSNNPSTEFDIVPLEAVVNGPSIKEHADKHDVEVSDESQEINFNQYFVSCNQQHGEKRLPVSL